MNIILRCMLALLVFAAIPVSIYIVFIKAPSRGPSLQTYGHVRYGRNPAHSGTPYSRRRHFNTMNIVSVSYTDLYSSIRIPPAALQQISRIHSTSRRAPDAEDQAAKIIAILTVVPEHVACKQKHYWAARDTRTRTSHCSFANAWGHDTTRKYAKLILLVHGQCITQPLTVYAISKGS
ncbi:hypothetical protein GGX14DRAFT_474133 [Mycena pura]|uniref:Uncharacterized protein n=1 Tax=Mycena pura TaxID=153505 RepID=A0AAD6V035_9AGAR|nr:hypothetical protein GGX14DRAFT_474133 [Mycena pura]